MGWGSAQCFRGDAVEIRNIVAWQKFRPRRTRYTRLFALAWGEGTSPMTGSTSCSAFGFGRQLAEVCCVRRHSAERWVRTTGIVEGEVAGQFPPGLGQGLRSTK